ncbi:MAG: Flagellar L-ring protein precursor [Verrucomicrobiota bacterium]|jgi:flagellar L-ring protein precursor FlgH
MLADKKALAVGDILTIVVAENTSNSKSTSTKTAKSSAVDASISSFLYSPAASGLLTKGGALPAMKMEGKNSFDGGGQIANSETITTRVAVRVVDVLPNRNLVIEGTRHTSSSGEHQDIILRGTVRADDVQANNTVFSYNIADATIKIVGKGAVSDAQKKGWFTKVWDKVSPF